MASDTQPAIVSSQKSSPAPPANSPRAAAKSRWIGFMVFGAIAGLLFWRPIIEWVQLALSAETRSYLLLVPVISAYLIRIKRHEVRLELTTSAIAGSVFTIAGIAAAFYA